MSSAEVLGYTVVIAICLISGQLAILPLLFGNLAFSQYPSTSAEDISQPGARKRNNDEWEYINNDTKQNTKTKQ